MLWLVLALVAALAVALIFCYSARQGLEAARLNFAREVDRLRSAQQQASFQLKAQQDAVFNSMTEGLLLLDENGRISLANRAFETLFGVTSDVRSRSLIEALRIHELAELGAQLSTDAQVLDRE